MSDTAYTGRCFCGHVQFTLSRAPTSACHCHCESCQRASGAPFVTWATFPSESFEITKGKLAERVSSPGVTRGHCAECGSAITYVRADDPGDIDITASCLDQPSRINPGAHIWIEDKQPWIEIGDDLPQYRQWSKDK